MDDLGRRVKQLREFRNLKPRQMARVALGKDASDDDLTEWANSLGKLERGDEGHTNPGLPRIYSTAKGFGFDELSEFFAELERVPDLINQQSKKDLSATVAKADNPANGSGLQAAFDRRITDHYAVSTVDLVVEALNKNSTAIADISAELRQLRATIGTVLGQRVVPSHEPAREDRPHKAAGRARGR